MLVFLYFIQQLRIVNKIKRYKGTTLEVPYFNNLNSNIFVFLNNEYTNQLNTLR